MLLTAEEARTKVEDKIFEDLLSDIEKEINWATDQKFFEKEVAIGPQLKDEKLRERLINKLNELGYDFVIVPNGVNYNIDIKW